MTILNEYTPTFGYCFHAKERYLKKLLKGYTGICSVM